MRRSPRKINMAGFFARKSSMWMLLWALVLSLLLPTSTTWAGPYTRLVVFGDSLSDNGNLLALTYDAIPPSPYFAGRFSSGPVWAEYLGSALDLPLVDFAVGGALTSRSNLFEAALGVDFPGLVEEIDQFIALNPEGADPNAVYVVWAGANDFRSAPSPTTIPVVIENLVTAIRRLTALGARHIVVPNQPDLGLTPEGLASGFSPQLTALSAAFNQTLADTLDAAGLDVIRVDVFALMHLVVKDPSEYGFTDVTTPCLTGLTVCFDPAAHLFWDRIHPTTEGHAVLAEKVAKAINQAILGRQNKP